MSSISSAVLEQDPAQDLLSLPAAAGQRGAGLLWAAVAVGLFAVALPFAARPLELTPRALLFGAVATTAISLCSLITAYMLFRQFAQIGRLRLVLLAYAYYLYGLLSLAQVLVFPWPSGDAAIGGAQASPIIWVLRHGMFAALFLTVGLAPRGVVVPSEARAGWQFSAIGAAPVAIGWLLFTLVTSGDRLPFFIAGNDFTALNVALTAGDWCIGVAALFAFVWGSKLRSNAHIWLVVASIAFLADVSLHVLFPSRANFGTRVALLESVISSFVVLWILLSESERLRTTVGELRDRALDVAKQKTEILSTMSHEIRTPVNAIIGMTDLLMETPLNTQQREYGAALQTAGEALLVLIDDILDLSKLEAGKLQLDEIAFDPWLVIEQSQEMIALQASKKGLAVRIAIDAAVPRALWGDANRLRQILVNLASNAVKFTERGSITIKAFVTGESGDRIKVRFEVVDTGIGIAPDIQGRLFAPFTQAERRTSRLFGGTGLGLSISRRLAILMNGTMGLQSREGAGSTFWFEIPFSRHAQHRHGDPGISGLRALVVCRDASDRETLKQYLGAWNIAVQTSDETLADPQNFDVVFVDDAPAERQERAGVPLIPIERPLRQSLVFDALMHVVVDRTHPPTAPPAIQKLSQNGEKPQILLVDDHPPNRTIVLQQLRRLGHHADVAGNGREAIEAVQRGHYELVIMDCVMPEVDGFEATRRIRAWEAGNGRHVPIIAMTANAMEGDREACLRAGMDDYISKPVRLPQLRRMLERYVAVTVA